MRKDKIFIGAVIALHAIPIVFLIVMCLSSMLNNETHYWKFDRESVHITEIKIVDADDPYCFSVIKPLDISLAQELMEDIEKLELKEYGWNLGNPHGKCIYIGYSNLEYDLIAVHEPKQVRYDEEGRLRYQNSFLECKDEESFNALIEKYLNK